MNKRQNSIAGYLYPLDGLRAISVILVFMYHTWQQSWIFYTYRLPNGFKLFDLTMFQRFGCYAVDFFFILSGFCLFYPIACSIFGERKFNGWKDFFIKRARRIYPAYIIVMAIVLIFPSSMFVLYDKSNAAETIKNILTNLLFIENITDAHACTIVSTAWTLLIEVQFYLIFPLICIPFRKKPVLTFMIMATVSYVIRLLFLCYTEDLSQVQQWTFCYFDLFGAGMLSAYFVVAARNKLKNMDKLKPFMTVMSVLCVVLVIGFFKWTTTSAFPQGVDVSNAFRFIYRFILTAAVSGFVFTACFSYDFWQKKIWGNKFFVFVSTISYSFYLIHQNVYIFLKNHNIPHSDMNPVMNDKPAMWGLTFICLGVTLALSIVITKFIEQPIAKYGYKGYFKNICSFVKQKPSKKAP